VGVPSEDLPEWAPLTRVVAADALDREVEPVGDPWVEAAGTVDRLLVSDLVARPDHHPADRVAQVPERFGLAIIEHGDDGTCLVWERGDDGVAAEPELSLVRLVDEVTSSRLSIGKVEARPVWKFFAPERPVVAVQRVAVRVGVFARGSVGLEVIRRVDQVPIERARPT